jgi:hypothetical protein
MRARRYNIIATQEYKMEWKEKRTGTYLREAKRRERRRRRKEFVS